VPFRFYFLIVLALAAPFIITIVTYRICRKSTAQAHSGRKLKLVGKVPRRTFFYLTRELDGDGSYTLLPSYSAWRHDQENGEDGAEHDQRH
jgi:hypothetical protein